MKLGILNHNNNIENFFSSYDVALVNLGDHIQSYGVEIAYNYYLLKSKKKLKVELIEKELISSYVGEKMIVTLNNVYTLGGVNGKLGWFPTSPDIIPLFIGFNCHDESLIFENKEYFKKWEPIGCRDEKTKELFQRCGISSYISGCSSILFPKRKKTTGSKVFVVDATEDLISIIPENILCEAEFISQNVYAKELCGKTDYHYGSTIFWNVGKELIKRYNDDAKLVITSKLHCVVPCIAMGIPVILAKDNIDYRFSWLDKLIPLYSESEYHHIDWNPSPIDIEKLKDCLLSIYYQKINQIITGEHFDIKEIDMIDNFYSARKKCKYNKTTIKRIEEAQTYSDLKNILIWGAGRTGGLFYETLRENFKDIDVIGFIDSYKTGYYKNLPIFHPSDLNENTVQGHAYDYIFLCSLPGKLVSIDKMNKLGKQEFLNYAQYYFEPERHGG